MKPRDAAGVPGRHQPGRPLRPRTRHPAPRPEAVQRADRPRGPAARHRLRPGQVGGGQRRRRPGRRPHALRRHRRHAGLHGPRADQQPARQAQPGQRRLQPRRDPLRDADRPAAVPGADAGGHAAAGARPGPGAAAAAQPQGRSRSGSDLPEVPAKGAGPALRRRRRPGRRPGSVPQRRGPVGRRAEPRQPARPAEAGAARDASCRGAGELGHVVDVPQRHDPADLRPDDRHASGRAAQPHAGICCCGAAG